MWTAAARARGPYSRRNGPAIGSGQAGPSALGQGIAQARRNVELAIRRAFASAGLDVPAWDRCAMAAGLSGVSHPPWRDAFIAANIGFAHLAAETDSFTMLLGAHGGKPGAILAAGTGSIAEALRVDGSRCTVGGWGFPAGDEGSGAWLGLQAWSDRAGQFAYARLAPIVFDCEAEDPEAATLLARATAELEAMAYAVDPAGKLPLAVSGSVGMRLAPRTSPALRSRLVRPAQGPEAGALMLIRRVVHAQMEEAL